MLLNVKRPVPTHKGRQTAQMLQSSSSTLAAPSPQTRSRRPTQSNYITGFDPRAEAEVRDLTQGVPRAYKLSSPLVKTCT